MDKNIMEDYSIIPKPVQIRPIDGKYSLIPLKTIWVCPDAVSIGLYLQALMPVPYSIERIQPTTEPKEGISLTITDSDPVLGSEGYKLAVSPSSITIKANQLSGLFYGVQTLRQLFPPGVIEIPAVEITDWPRFPWRGIMLDVGRHFFSVDFIKHLLDVMAFHKLNVFHWHLTEDQGWRIAIKKYPKLTRLGSKRSASPIPSSRDQLDGVPYKGFYSQKQIKEIVSYAASRYITVVPEIEMPGHSVAALASYPELGCTGGPYHVRNYWGIEDDVYCAGNEQVYGFLEDVLDEVLALFPFNFIHIGGDECPKERWHNCPKCQAVIHTNNLKDEHELQSYFIGLVEKYLNSKNRRIIGWDEILEGGLAPNASVMSWRGMEGGIIAAREGHDVVMTPTKCCYFDYYQSIDVNHEPPAIGGIIPLETVYSFDPIPPECTADEARHILGSQGNLWTEYISTPEQAEFMLFPRTCALAEVLWSKLEGRYYPEFVQRLGKFTAFLDNMAVNYRR